MSRGQYVDRNKKGLQRKRCNPLIYMVPQPRVELGTY